MIILIRHASPIINYNCCSSKIAKDRLLHYNETDELKYEEIDPFVSELQNLFLNGAGGIVYTSTSPREINTALYIFKRLKLDLNHNPIFSEFDLDISNLPIKLSIKQWFFISRIACMFGIRGNDSDFFEERKRSVNATNLLDLSHSQETNIILVGHGFINRYIKRNLERGNLVLVNIKKSGCFEVQYF